MTLKITEALLKPVLPGAKYSRTDIIESRFHYLGDGIAEANTRKSVFFVIRGEIPDMLNISEPDLLQLGRMLDTFRGAAVLIVADLDETIISKFRPFISQKVLFFPDDTNKNLSIRDMLAMVELFGMN